MMRSIRHFLLISLLTSITLASSITAVGNYLLDRKILRTHLDNQLLKAFSFVEIMTHAVSDTEPTRVCNNIRFWLAQDCPANKKDLFFRVDRTDGHLLFQTDTPDTDLLRKIPKGFSDVYFRGHNWRAYTAKDATFNYRIIVAEPQDTRNRLIDAVAHSNVYILLVTYPLFGMLIWLIVNLALRSVTRVTREISNRAPSYLEPVEAKNIPEEIRPLVDELNRLFQQLKFAFERNKRFAGDAAHELRTPLAAVKTQAQVAQRAEDAVVRRAALQKVITGVDRSSHIVNQLLTLSRLGQDEELNDIRPLDLQQLVTEIVAYLVPTAREKNISISLDAPATPAILAGNDVALGILVRNIVDNAIRYTPNDGEIIIAILISKTQVILRVMDTGPGIPPELRQQVFGRFYRIIGTTAPGSGLGLAIVAQIAKLHRAEIDLETAPQGGLQFSVHFPRLIEDES